LGGNAKTVMIATLSPASDNFDETLSTLRCVPWCITYEARPPPPPPKKKEKCMFWSVLSPLTNMLFLFLPFFLHARTTARYADRAKQIVNKAIVNEDSVFSSLLEFYVYFAIKR
jgi:hypothetical protein